jgi:hypothetical protein
MTRSSARTITLRVASVFSLFKKFKVNSNFLRPTTPLTPGFQGLETVFPESLVLGV